MRLTATKTTRTTLLRATAAGMPGPPGVQVLAWPVQLAGDQAGRSSRVTVLAAARLQQQTPLLPQAGGPSCWTHACFNDYTQLQRWQAWRVAEPC